MQDRVDLARLDGVVAAYEVGPQCVVIETEQGREIRITARRDLRTGKYQPLYERQVQISNHGATYQVWAHTPAYQAFTADDVGACLAQAAEEVSRLRRY